MPKNHDTANSYVRGGQSSVKLTKPEGLKQRIEKLRRHNHYTGYYPKIKKKPFIGRDKVLTELDKTYAEIGHILEHYSYIRTQVLKALSNESVHKSQDKNAKSVHTSKDIKEGKNPNRGAG